MDHLGVLRDKIGLLRVEIADIQELNQQFRRDGRNGTGVQVAHGQRSERLQEIQRELLQLADLAAELFPQNEWQRSIPLGRTPSNKSERPSVWLFIKTLPHTRRTNQTMTRMTTIVPTTPIPNIVPPVGNVGHLEHLINDGRASFRL